MMGCAWSTAVHLENEYVLNQFVECFMHAICLLGAVETLTRDLTVKVSIDEGMTCHRHSAQADGKPRYGSASWSAVCVESVAASG